MMVNHRVQQVCEGDTDAHEALRIGLRCDVETDAQDRDQCDDEHRIGPVEHGLNGRILRRVAGSEPGECPDGEADADDQERPADPLDDFCV